MAIFIKKNGILQSAGLFTKSNNVLSRADINSRVKCTVSNLGAENPSDVVFTKDPNFTKAWLGIGDFMFSDEPGADVFVKIPTMYRKVNTVINNQITSFTIANAKIDNDYQPYSCFMDESGNTLPYILIGKYWNTSSSSCISTTEASAIGITTENGRTYARAKGDGYQLFDWQIQKLWQDIIICLKKTVNTNTGKAWTYDELGIYWTISDGWVDGVIRSNGTWKFCMKPSKYTSLVSEASIIPDDYVSAGYSCPTSSNEIQELGYDANYSFFNFPSRVVSNSSNNTYYCDKHVFTPVLGNCPVVSVVGRRTASNGAFSCDTSFYWSGKSGVRLCYRPITQ